MTQAEFLRRLSGIPIDMANCRERLHGTQSPPVNTQTQHSFSSAAPLVVADVCHAFQRVGLYRFNSLVPIISSFYFRETQHLRILFAHYIVFPS